MRRPRLSRGFKRATTPRGFPTIDFSDSYGQPCGLQVSSMLYKNMTSSALWIKSDGEDLHLNLDQVKVLAKVLNHWIETGDL